MRTGWIEETFPTCSVIWSILLFRFGFRVKLETLLGKLSIAGRHFAIALLESCLPTIHFPV
jgi:hypothetical protein